MPNQEQSPDAAPDKDAERTSPDAQRDGGGVNLDDDDMVHPRGKVTGAGGPANAKGGDSAPLGPPGAGLSDRNGPSDPDTKKP